MSYKFTALLAGLALFAAGAAQAADQVAWVEGKNYQLITPALETTGDKLEVVEVFSYACPHCAHFQPFADKLKSELPADVAYVYKPAVFFKQWEPYARAYLAARAMGVADKAHQALFDALHRDHQPIHTLQDLALFYSQFGVSAGEITSTAESFVITSQMQTDMDWERKAGVMGTPTLIIDGKYRLDANSAGGNQQLVDLAKWLVDKELAARRAAH